jgi:hypothetical protein
MGEEAITEIIAKASTQSPLTSSRHPLLWERAGVRPQTPFMNTQPTPYSNEWKRYHNSLNAQQGKRFKTRIEYVLGISQSAFYRKLKHPHRYLTTAEKWAIARIYNLKETYLFPELEELA